MYSSNRQEVFYKEVSLKTLQENITKITRKNLFWCFLRKIADPGQIFCCRYFLVNSVKFSGFIF